MRVPAEERRVALAQAAIRLITREGVARASVRNIAAEAGMSLASVHYVFASRDELLRAAISLVIEEERAAAASPLDLPADVELTAILRAGVAAYLELVKADPRREQGMLELTHHALRNPELADLARDQYEQYYALVSGLLEQVGERYDIEWRLPVAVLARWVIAFTDGLTMQWLAAPDEAAAEAQLDLVAEVLDGQAEKRKRTRP